jgi:hypothetical protein
MSALKLTRAQLAEFLKNPQTIKAFENIFEIVTETTPSEFLELSILVNSLKRAANEASNKVSELQTVEKRSLNVSELMKRIEALEMQNERRLNYNEIIRRIENLEKLTGV